MLVLGWVALAWGADPTFAGADKTVTEAEKPDSTLSAELGGTFTSGNTETFTLNGALHGSHTWKRNRMRVDLGANLGQSVVDADGDGHLDDDERAAGRAETARKYWSDVRYDRFVSQRDSLYVLAGALVDPFAGYDARTHGQVGVSHTFVDAERTKVLAELGADVAHENFVAGVTPNDAWIVAAHVLGGVTHEFNDVVSIDEKVDVYENVLDPNDVRVLNTAALSAALGTVLSLKVSHQLTFDNVPVEGFRKLDQTSMVTVVATLL